MSATKEAVQLVMAAQARQWAHSLGNPLTGLLLTLELLQQSEQPGSRQGQVARCLHALEGLLDFQRTLGMLGSPAEATVAGCADVPIGAAWRAATSAVPAVARPHTTAEVVPPQATVWANELLLSVVLRALYSNAAQASGAGGRVQLMGRPKGTGFELHVADDGPGVPAGLQPQLFVTPSPRDGAACGMGLPTAALIVERIHGGEIAYVPRPDRRGACFRIFLPGRPPHSVPNTQAQPS